ncbi:MAG: hypothetical protein ACR2IL_02325 [Chitinophagaceae bacterium]
MATPEALHELQGWENDGRRLEFIQDENGNYIVGTSVLDDVYYMPIFDKLNLLERIEFVPIQN